MSARKILMIEDDQDIALAHGTILRLEGFDVVTAPDAIIALTVARQEKPDLILLDIGLPGGGGVTVLERLRSFLATAITPVLVVTGSEMIGPEEAKQKGAQGFIKKPVDADHLVRTIKQLLGDTPGDS